MFFIIETLVVLIIFLFMITILRKRKKYNDDEDITKKSEYLWAADLLTEYACVQSLLQSRALQTMALVFVLCFGIFLYFLFAM